MNPSQYYSLGLLPFPITYKAKSPLISWKRNGWYDNRPSLPVVLQEFRKHKEHNIGILCGKSSNNLVVLDFDTIPSYLLWKRQYNIESFTVKTRRGYHVYTFCDELPQTLKGKTTKYRVGSCDVIANGYVVAPNSIHPSGFIYKIVNDSKICHLVRVDDVGMNKPSSEGGCVAIELPQNNTNTFHSLNGNLADNVKSCMPVSSYLSQFTDTMYSTGDKWLMCRCPFHNDGRPSMWINTEFQRCKCLATHCIASEKALDVIECCAILEYGGLNSETNKKALFDLASRVRLL